MAVRRYYVPNNLLVNCHSEEYFVVHTTCGEVYCLSPPTLLQKFSTLLKKLCNRRGLVNEALRAINFVRTFWGITNQSYLILSRFSSSFWSLMEATQKHCKSVRARNSYNSKPVKISSFLLEQDSANGLPYRKYKQAALYLHTGYYYTSLQKIFKQLRCQ